MFGPYYSSVYQHYLDFQGKREDFTYELNIVVFMNTKEVSKLCRFFILLWIYKLLFDFLTILFLLLPI